MKEKYEKLPQIYTANNATFPIQIREITVQICGNIWVTKHMMIMLISGRFDEHVNN